MQIIVVAEDSSDVTSMAAVVREFSVPSVSIVRIQTLRGWFTAKFLKSLVEVNAVFDSLFHWKTDPSSQAK